MKMKDLLRTTGGKALACVAIVLALYAGVYAVLRISGRISVLPPNMVGNTRHYVFGVMNEEFGPGMEDRRITYAFFPLCKLEGRVRDVTQRR
jgi:hypothetical protein